MENLKWIRIYEDLIKRVGLKAGYLYQYLLQKSIFYKEHAKDGYFYCTVKTIQNNIGLGKTAQENAIKKLINEGLIELKYMGLPRRRYFKVHDIQEDSLSGQQMDMDQSSWDEVYSLVGTKHSHLWERIIPTCWHGTCHKYIYK